MSSDLEPPQSQGIIRALNYHGAFFKKQVLRKLAERLRVAEEFGATFGQTRVADIIAYDGEGLFLVIECKKASVSKKWVFLKHLEQRYRRSRAIGATHTLASVLDHSPPPHPLVCSEGYEISRPTGKDWKANQDPIFQAAAQLSAAYLGFIARRLAESTWKGIQAFVPVLVTNAQLAFVESDFVVHDETGEADLSAGIQEVPFVILRHPYPEIGNGLDFRTLVDDDDYQQRYQESIYVVNVARLNDFVSTEHRKQLRDLESGANPRSFI
jgi:hypothetical protein